MVTEAAGLSLCEFERDPVQLLMQAKMPHLWQAKTAAVRFATILLEET